MFDDRALCADKACFNSAPVGKRYCAECCPPEGSAGEPDLGDPERYRQAYDAVCATLSRFGERNVLVLLGKALYVDSLQMYERMGDVPAMTADIINLACKYATPAERGESPTDDLDECPF